MGIYISDLEIPKDKDVQIVIIRDDGICVDDCGNTYGVVSLPSHGDLIDRDATKGSIKPWSPEDERSGCTFDTVKKLMYTMLDRAPTVIPASEEGET